MGFPAQTEPFEKSDSRSVARIGGSESTMHVHLDEEKIEKKLRDHALFISFAPAKNPKIAVPVIVENGGSGSSVAAPIAKRIMDLYLLGQNQ